MLKPASLFTDGAVLCRGKEIRVFGQADEGARVTARLISSRGDCLAEGVGQSRGGWFCARLKPQEAQTGCLLQVLCGHECFTARDVAVGEVFLAGGQSNMELPLCNADEGPEQIATHQDPLIRFFNVPRCAQVGQEQQKALEETRWRAIAPGKGEDDSAVAWFFAQALRRRLPGVAIGILGCYWGGTSITCWMDEETLKTTSEGTRYWSEYAKRTANVSMEAWQQAEDLFQAGMNRWNEAVAAFRKEHPDASWRDVDAACGLAPWNPPEGPGSPYRPAGLADAMLKPVSPYTLTGILYYQGEEDTGKTDCYDLLMISMIRFWRTLFQDAELPFLFVQLPMWKDFGAQDSFRWPLTRKAQAAARDAVRNTGMVCLLDQGELGNIHPTAKRPVGERLAELAGEMLYGGGEVSCRAVGKYTEGDEMTVMLSGPVNTPKGEKPALLEIAGEDGVFAPARAEIRGRMLLLRAEGVNHPMRARYAWTDYSDRANLFGENGLPLEPFDL